MTQIELEIIKNADFSGDSRDDEIYSEMQGIIRDITENYTHPEYISSEKVDMTSIIKQYGYDVDLYKKTFGSVARSEEDVCKRLIEIIKKGGKQGKATSTEPNKTTDDKEKRIRIARAKANALNLLVMLELEL